jgi:hypothetical protein
MDIFDVKFMEVLQLKVSVTGHDLTNGEFTELSIEQEAILLEEQPDYEIELVRNQNKIMSLWYEIVQ